ncbi:bifunctional glycoside hydrolase 114/ polysaccharide deacetylase family protein [Venenivibrio stagnispumantis]|uniref:Extracellular protein n=1 Tax=Venenivibrio stagnispumantis TaxID=407998 RepID=A0AA45WIC3_9AQUI|nr:endo alpha-1,4 polygalactosaminidase [Venenivibrio stagnispumantis]MCW4572766.1 endo alpha-1,4 polygalactosaminidase [Venenivibrio stagnispumantis]SMP00314.1 extracellular protein [Venenivibrio stagnispumantis]
MILSMKRFLYSKLLFIFLFIYGVSFANENLNCGVLFYYKDKPPPEAVKLFDYIVVDPDVVNKAEKKYVAYLSVGEIEPYRNYYKNIKKEWIIGENKVWKSYIADVSNQDYIAFLMKLVDNLYQKGYRAIFFDTLDSYQQVVKQDKWNIYATSIGNFVKQVKYKYPDIKIFTNRGFEFIDNSFNGIIDFVVAEGLFSSYDFKNQKYKDASFSDTKWLLDKLNYVKQVINAKIIVIDYTDNKQKAIEYAKKIKSLGFIPYVADINLETIGIGNCIYKPRKILVIYNDEASKDFSKTVAYRLIPIALEFMGYMIEGVNPDKENLPEKTLDRYAGIIVIPESSSFKNENFFQWIKKRIDEGNKVLFLNYFGFDITEDNMKQLGIEISQNQDKKDFKIKKAEKYTGFEAPIDTSYTDTLFSIKEGKPVIELENSINQIHIPVAITKWGGYALSENFLISSPNELFIIDPFIFIKEALRLEDIPAPDITTENGRRIFFSHIDGDGFIEKAVFNPSKYASQIIKEEIFEKYDIPITVSIIEGEIAPYGIRPQESEKLEKIAKEIFAMPNIEIANHSFSHPFKWQNLEVEGEKEGYNLNIPGYKFSLEREIIGSTEYINNKLAPEDKKVKVFLWTGDCNPSENALKLTYQIGLLNMNGGGSTMTNLKPYLAQNYPIGVKKGDYYQIYAPNQNENVYTNLWTSNFHGFVNVIQTFKLTDKPRRIKPINVYYHFYSGSKLSSLKALKEVYDYVLSQKITPMFASQWIERALDFYNTVLAQDLEGNWLIKTDGKLRTIKIPKSKGYPSITESVGIIGFNDYNNERYIHLSNGDKYYLVLKDKPENNIYLKESNAMIEKFEKNKDGFYLKLKGYLPVEVIFSNAKNCVIKSDKYINIKNINDELIINSEEKEVNLNVQCSKK